METKNKIQLVVGLGNPGPQYEKTRHNVGFWLVGALAGEYGCKIKSETKFKGLLGTVNIADDECRLLMPLTFMNLSGESVSKVVQFYKIPVESILVVHDELDFAPGVVRLKEGGSANSHNGVQNIIDLLGSNDFWRMRIGIGKPAIKEAMNNYVTSAPSKAENQHIFAAIDRAIKILPDLVNGNFTQAIQDLHSFEPT